MVGNSFQVAVLFADDPGQQRIPGQRALAHRQIHLPYSTWGRQPLQVVEQFLSWRQDADRMPSVVGWARSSHALTFLLKRSSRESSSSVQGR
jgi:hypothetical protein